LPLIVIGCSPYVYQTETAGFAAGVDQLKKAHESAISALISDRETILRNSAATARTPVFPSPDCLSKPVLPQSVGVCTLTGKAPGTTTAELKASVDVERNAAVALTWLTVLDDYGAALTAITDATNRAALVDAQGKLAASIKALAKQHDDAVIAKAEAGDAKAAKKPLIGDAAAASAGLIAAATSAILDRQRLEALEVAVKQADEPVRTLAFYIGDEQVLLQDAARGRLTQYATRLTNGLGPASEPDDYEAALDKALAATTELDAIIGANPQRAADKMAEAHGELLKAVTSGKGQSLTAIESITEFVAAATAVRDAFGKTAADALSGSGS
jgi:hypothetical protein